MNIKTDALGVYSAVKVKYAIETLDSLSMSDIKAVCRAVINRYDKSVKSADLSTKAQHVMRVMACVVPLKAVLVLADSLIPEEELAELEESVEQVADEEQG